MEMQHLLPTIQAYSPIIAEVSSTCHDGTISGTTITHYFLTSHFNIALEL